MAKSILTLSMPLRNITRLCRYAVSVRSNTTSNANQVIIDHSTEVTPPSKQLQLLNSDVSPISLVTSIMQNKDLYDANHIIQALSLMQKYYKENQVPISIIHNSDDFVQLCKILQSHLLKLDTYQATEALKILNQLRVSGSTRIIQSLLQIIRCSLNELVLEQVYFLTFLLDRMEENPLTKAILCALPQVFMAQVKVQLDKDDLRELSSALIYASKHIEDKDTIEFILDATDGNYDSLDLDSALKIFWALGDIKSSSVAYTSLLDKCQLFLMEESKPGSSLDGPKIFRTLMVMADKVFEGQSHFYNSVVVHNLTNRFLECNYRLDQGLLVLNKLIKIKHVCLPLIDHLLWEVHNNHQFLSVCNPFAISSLVRGLAMANYKPQCWEETKELILKNYTRIVDMMNLFYLAVDLAALGCFDHDLLKLVFSEFHNPYLLARDSMYTLKRLYQCVRTLHPAYDGPWPSQLMIFSFMEMEHHSEVNNKFLLSCFEKIFGCSSLIKCNVKTELGHHIDFLVVLQDGIPVVVESKHPNVESSSSNVEDLDIPYDFERLAIILLPESAYPRNVKILDAVHAMYLRSLEAMDYIVVPVPMPVWMASPEWERLPFLRQLINEQLQAKKIACL
ncbi:hypothetical protein QAD02_014659 [Eretmocerus hayati]|uniref:Uncharacterized protein n=1 Tax=Eretmocerus hayati TaxID=131215 RepID=A0ACC2P654_9HYME|nr:hypothetical protein QAD02_014659 [Eretmocerus hayati]